MADRVKGKIALVTGGASGIGRGAALLLAKEGATVVVSDIQDDMGKDTVTSIKKAGGDAVYLRHDVANDKSHSSDSFHLLHARSKCEGSPAINL